MARVENIRLLFSTIRVESVRAYLITRGWRVIADELPQRIRFEGLVSEDGTPYQLWLWANEEHPKFRDALPNLIFKLSVIEGREPLDLANDIAQARIPDSSAEVKSQESPEPSFQRLHIGNTHTETPLQLVISQRHLRHGIACGESVEVIVEPGNRFCELAINGPAVELVVDSHDSVRLYQGLPTQHRREPMPSIRELVRESLASHAGLSVERRTELLEELQTLLKRIEFELPNNANGTFDSEASLRQTAVLVATLVRHLPADPATATCVFQLASRVLGRAGLFFEIGNETPGRLLDASRNDDEHAPTITLAVLREQAVSLPSR